MCGVIDPPTREVGLPGEIAEVITDMLTHERTGSVVLHFAKGRVGAWEQKRQLPSRKPHQLTGETREN